MAVDWVAESAWNQWPNGVEYASRITKTRRIFPQPAGTIRLQAYDWIEKNEDTAKTVAAYATRLSTLGLKGKESPRAARILPWCSSGRGR